VDSGLRTGSEIGTEFDPMVAKVPATGSNRPHALSPLAQALDAMTILAANTTLEYLQHLIRDPDVATGDMDTTLVEQRLPGMVFDSPTSQHAQMAARLVHHSTPTPSLAWRDDGFRLTGAVSPTYRVHTVEEDPRAFEIALTSDAKLTPTNVDHEFVYQDESGTRRVALIAETPKSEGTRVWVASDTFTGVVSVLDHRAQVLHNLASLEAEERGVDPQVRAPLPGTVTAVHVPDGRHVT